MPAPGFVQSAAGIDLSQRIAGSTTVVASPTDNTETVIGSVTVPGGLSYATGVFVVAWAAFTVGTNGVSINLKVRQTSVSGSTIAATGVTNEGVTAATQLGTRVVWGLDTAPGDSQIYKATLTVGSGSAASTVSALFLGVFAVQRVSEQLYEFTHDYPFHTPLPDLQPQNATSVAYVASLVVVPGRARCFGFQGYNSGAAQFILVLDRSDLPGDGAVPKIVIPVAATSVFSGYFGSAGRWFNQGIVLCNSSTGPTKTIGAADCWFDVQFVSGDQGQPVGIVSGGGGGPAAGSYIPVANKAGVTVDATTYADVLKGGGAKLTTLVFPAGAQGAIAFALSGDAFPRLVWSSDVSGSGLFIGDGTGEPTANNANLTLDPTSAQQGFFTPGTLRGSTLAATQVQFPLLKQVSPLHSITSGALPTQQLVSGTGAQLAAPGDLRDVETVTPCTFNPGAATTATVTVALSSDNVTYSTLAVVTEPAGVALDGTILPVKVRVPAGWYLKLTANAQAVLGLTTYY